MICTGVVLIFLLYWGFFEPTSALAWREEYAEPSTKDYLYKMIRSRFGTLVMVFCGFGGFATIYMQRTGRAGDQIPLVGVAMLLIAIFMFMFRTMITSGLLGAQYLDYGG